MDPHHRIVTRLPLESLFDARGPVAALRCERLSASAVAALLSQGVRRFVVANVGQPLRWVPEVHAFEFWKAEGKHRIADLSAEAVDVSDYPEGLVYFASRWRLGDGEDIIVFEASH